jgi:hypothetical protein
MLVVRGRWTHADFTKKKIDRNSTKLTPQKHSLAADQRRMKTKQED